MRTTLFTFVTNNAFGNSDIAICDFNELDGECGGWGEGRCVHVGFSFM